MPIPLAFQLAMLGPTGTEYADSLDMTIAAGLRSLGPRVISVIVDVIDGDAAVALDPAQHAQQLLDADLHSKTLPS